LLADFSYPQNGGDKLLRHVGFYKSYTGPYSRRLGLFTVTTIKISNAIFIFFSKFQASHQNNRHIIRDFLPNSTNRRISVRLEVFTAATIKNGVFCDVSRVALAKTEVSEELSASIIRVTRLYELGTSAVTNNLSSLPIEENYGRFEALTAVTIKNGVF
jgi:hypothetical protein